VIVAKSANASSLNFGRIAKPLRGGGAATSAAVPASSSGASYSIGGGSANPLARVQEEPSCKCLRI
jgi:kinesin family protein 5